jgi:hypothetical protein
MFHGAEALFLGLACNSEPWTFGLILQRCVAN